MAPGGGQGRGPGDADFVVVANRLPIDMERLPDGSTTWKRSPGGLVTALEPLLRRRRGAWIGWPGIPDADDEPIEQDDMHLYPVRLSADDVANYYEGFSNATLWPLYHDVIVKPIYHREWWDAYVDVNRRFAEATAKVAAEGATVWVQDYQLQLVPKMLRMLRPDLTIGFFLHIPFPPVELFMQMPWRTEIIEGLLGADLVGFHLPGGAQNFLILARRLVGANTSRATVGVRSRFGEVNVGFRTVKVGAFPISIDSAALDQQARNRAVRQRAARSAASSAIRARSCSASTDWTTPRASTFGCRRSRSCSTSTGPSATTPCWCSSPPPAASASRATSRCARTSSARSATSTASTARSATRSCTTCTGRSPATSSSRSSWPPTSCWSPRCATA